MQLSDVQDHAISARMALIVAAKTFDRMFAGIHFDEVDGDILFVYAKDEDTAAQIEDKLALHISIIASKIPGREINIVMVYAQWLYLCARLSSSALRKQGRARRRFGYECVFLDFDQVAGIDSGGIGRNATRQFAH